MNSPSGVWGGAPAKKRNWVILSVTEHFWLQYIVNYENRVLQAEKQYAMYINFSLVSQRSFPLIVFLAACLLILRQITKQTRKQDRSRQLQYVQCLCQLTLHIHRTVNTTL